MSNRKKKKQPAYIRNQGTRGAVSPKERVITFSLSKHVKGEGQSIEEWEEEGLLAKLLLRMKYVGQHSVHVVRQKQYIKEYHKVDFPPDSEFNPPKHVIDVIWAVMHITPKSKEVVIGFIEDDVFNIIFLDKEHKFWPSDLKNT